MGLSERKCLSVGFASIAFLIYLSLFFIAPASAGTCRGKDFTFDCDFRLRYQWQERDGLRRGRERIRLRLNFSKEVVSGLRVGFGLATGGDDPRSTNQTLSESFSTPDFRLNCAYVGYEPVDGLMLWGGKYAGIKKVLWVPTDLLWDSDLTPEGGGVVLKVEAGRLEFYGNIAFFLLDEVKDEEDPMMFTFQPAVRVSLNDNIRIKGAIGYYSTRNLKGKILPYSSGSNTLAQFISSNGDTIAGIANEFVSIEPAFSIEVGELPDPVEMVSLFGSYVTNSEVGSAGTGYAIGVKLGTSSMKEKGKWQVKYIRRRLEKDAWPDIFPDSDAYDGMTGIEGDEVIVSLSVAEGVIATLDYYHMKPIGGSSKERLLQADLLIKF